MFRASISRILFTCLLFFLTQQISAQNFTLVKFGHMGRDRANSEACAWGDYDNDGYEDLFVANGLISSDNNFLYRNQGPTSGFSFERITGLNLVSDGGGSRASSWGDYDNDGDLDLFVANQQVILNNFLYQNNGNGTFTRVTEGHIVNDSMQADPAGWVDFNNDGYLDMFVGSPANKPKLLYVNNGDGTFSRITEGDIVNDLEDTVGHGWGDFDNDGDVDLLAANRMGSSSLYINNNGTSFTRQNIGPVVADSGLHGGANWIDYDNDRDLDLSLSAFGPDQFNILFRNEGPGSNYSFTKTSGVFAEDTTDWSGLNWADIDNDGDLDCYVANFGDLSFTGTTNMLYMNDGDGTFSRITTGEIATLVGTSVGTAWADYDNDGDIDIYVCNTFSFDNHFFRNDLANGNGWLKVKLRGVQSNYAAIGAKIHLKSTIYGNPTWQLRVVEGQSRGLGQNSLIAHFGLGDAAIVDSLVIVWPSGIRDRYAALDINQFLTAIENDNVSSLSEPLLATNDFQLHQNYPNPFNPLTTITYALQRPQAVRLVVYDILGREVQTLVDQFQKAGKHSVVWNGKNQEGQFVGSGLYIYRIMHIGNPGDQSKGYSQSRKMLLVK